MTVLARDVKSHRSDDGTHADARVARLFAPTNREVHVLRFGLGQQLQVLPNFARRSTRRELAARRATGVGAGS